MLTLFRFLAAVWVATLLSGCAATHPGSAATRSPSILSDSVLARLDTVLPAAADSVEGRSIGVPRSPLAQWLAPRAARKDKRRLHVTVYNAPAVVKGGSTAVIGDGNATADNKKARGPVAVGDSSSATDNTRAGQKGGAAALGPSSQASAVTEAASASWWVYVLVFLAGVVVGFVGVVAYLVRRARS